MTVVGKLHFTKIETNFLVCQEQNDRSMSILYVLEQFRPVAIVLVISAWAKFLSIQFLDKLTALDLEITCVALPPSWWLDFLFSNLETTDDCINL